MKKGIFQIEKEKCVLCGGCVSVCPKNVIELLNEKKLTTNTNICIGCMSCAIFCPMGALKLKGRGELMTETV